MELDRVSDSSAPSPGWAAYTVRQSLWRGSAVGGAVWVPTLGLEVAVATPEWTMPVLACSLLILIPAVAGAVRPQARVWPELWCVALLASVALDLYVIQDEVASAAVYMSFPIVAAPAFVLPLRRAMAMIGVGTMAAVLCAAAGGAESRTVASLVVIAVCYTAGVVAVVRTLRNSASSADHQAAIADAEHERFAAARAAAHTRADYARTMHDTVVNTLTAVASGGAGVDLRRAGRCWWPSAFRLPLPSAFSASTAVATRSPGRGSG